MNKYIRALIVAIGAAAQVLIVLYPGQHWLSAVLAGVVTGATALGVALPSVTSSGSTANAVQKTGQ